MRLQFFRSRDGSAVAYPKNTKQGLYKQYYYNVNYVILILLVLGQIFYLNSILGRLGDCGGSAVTLVSVH